MNQCLVMKLGGEVIASPAMPEIAAEIVKLHATGARVAVVHGGAAQATDLQKRLGQTPTIVGGRRVTDAETLEVMKMCVAGKVNVDACAALLAAGLRPVGLHGASALAIGAIKRPPRVVTGCGPDPIDFGHVGDVAGINEPLFTLLMDAGYLPVLACLGADEQGRCYNINADVVATTVSVVLRASAAVLVTNVPGVLRDLNDPGSRIARLTVRDGRRAISDGWVRGGMIPKLEESFGALEKGVRAVHILGCTQAGQLARELSHPGSVGTVLVP